MGLKDQGKVVLEVGLNELATKEQNRHVAYGADEIASDIAACMTAGATLVHYHARYDDGSQAWADSEISRRLLDAASERADVIAYPSYFRGDLSHVLDLADNPSNHRMQVSCFDVFQHVSFAEWDEATRTMGSFDFDLGPDVPPMPAYPPVLDELSKRDIVPNVAVFDSGDLRWTVCATRMGILRQPVNIKMFFSDRWLPMNEPEPRVLDYLLSRIPDDLEYELVVVPYALSAESVETMLRSALERGLGIRVGIGDNTTAFPDKTNAELVEWATSLCAEYGLSPASPAEFRDRNGISLAVTGSS